MVLTRLRGLSAGVPPFSFELAELGWFGDEVLWLGPDQRGVVAFRELTAMVCGAFPSCQPYGGAFDEVIPHLTVGDHGDREQMRAVRAKLPLMAKASALTLMADGNDRRWTVAARMAFGRRS